jgi:ADP-ribose pyrophosphatase YjhB (NUDIX family)
MAEKNFACVVPNVNLHIGTTPHLSWQASCRSAIKFALITGFMEAGETPEEGITREIKEETNLQVSALKLIGVYDFQRMNQVIIAYHAVASGTVKLSPELAEYQMFNFDELVCWPAGTGYALGDWLRTEGIEPKFMTWEERDAQGRAS